MFAESSTFIACVSLCLLISVYELKKFLYHFSKFKKIFYFQSNELRAYCKSFIKTYIANIIPCNIKKNILFYICVFVSAIFDVISPKCWYFTIFIIRNSVFPINKNNAIFPMQPVSKAENVYIYVPYTRGGGKSNGDANKGRASNSYVRGYALHNFQQQQRPLWEVVCFFFIPYPNEISTSRDVQYNFKPLIC